MIRKTLEYYWERPHQILPRILIFVLSSIYFGLLPLLLFLVYMAQHQMFSYDLFTSGQFGIGVFFWLSVVGLVVGALAFFGSVTIWMSRANASRAEKGGQSEPNKAHKFDRGTFGLYVVINLIFIALLLGSLYFADWEGLSTAVYLAALLFTIAVHLGAILYRPPSVQLRSFAVLVLVSVAVPVLSTGFAPQLLGASLQRFGVGGLLPTTVHQTRGDSVSAQQGELLLFSPANLYLRDTTGSDTVLVITPINAVKSVHISRRPAPKARPADSADLPRFRLPPGAVGPDTDKGPGRP